MVMVSISEFRKNMKKYAEMVKSEDIVVVSNGKPVMRVTYPSKNKLETVRRLRGIAKTDKTYEEILKEKLKEL